MTSAEIIRRVTQKTHEEESIKAEGDTKRIGVDYRAIRAGVELLDSHGYFNSWIPAWLLLSDPLQTPLSLPFSLRRSFTEIVLRLLADADCRG